MKDSAWTTTYEVLCTIIRSHDRHFRLCFACAISLLYIMGLTDPPIPSSSLHQQAMELYEKSSLTSSNHSLWQRFPPLAAFHVKTSKISERPRWMNPANPFSVILHLVLGRAMPSPCLTAITRAPTPGQPGLLKASYPLLGGHNKGLCSVTSSIDLAWHRWACLM